MPKEREAHSHDLGRERRCDVRLLTLACTVLLAGQLSGCSGGDSFRRGIAGESCRARNDCADGLACLREVCIPAGTDLSVTGRACYRVECDGDADCCASFVPDPNCSVYEADCQADPSDCEAFHALCQCNRACDAELCVDVGPSCSDDLECPAFTTPFCVSSRCVQCREHGDCVGENARCVEGTCKDPCATDENCPLLHACEAGVCVASGCQTDRECAFVLGDDRARCAEGACFVGCEDNAECDSASFEVCHQGRCTFAGCETDAECRALLGLSETNGSVRAECR